MAMATAMEQYEYLRLQDAILCIGQKVNFYGVVSEYQHPKPTRGSDMICTMTIEDMSYNSPGLRVLVFAADINNLPQVKSVGDVIRFHRVSIGIHKDAPQAVARVGRGATFVLFECKEGSQYIPYQVSTKNYTFEQYDRDMLDLIHAWIANHTLTTGKVEYVVPISGIGEGVFFDLCCKILFVDRRPSPQNLIIYVWDGTDAAPPAIKPFSGVDGDESEMEHFISQSDYLQSIEREVIHSFPPIGTALAVIPEVSYKELPFQLPEPGNWVKFRNLRCIVRYGVPEALFLRESKISLLSSSDQLIKMRNSAYAERELSEIGRLPQQAPKPLMSITVTDYEHVPFSTLREVLMHPQVTYKFRCLVRIVAIYPPNVEDFCALQKNDEKESARLIENVPKQADSCSYVYRLRLTLDDPSARIHAFLCGEDAVKFFNGHPAKDLKCQNATKGALQRKICKLLGVKLEHYDPYRQCPWGVGERNPPWIKCCLKSYYLDKSKPWESRHYKIFATSLPG